MPAGGGILVVVGVKGDPGGCLNVLFLSFLPFVGVCCSPVALVGHDPLSEHHFSYCWVVQQLFQLRA